METQLKLIVTAELIVDPLETKQQGRPRMEANPKERGHSIAE